MGPARRMRVFAAAAAVMPAWLAPADPPRESPPARAETPGTGLLVHLRIVGDLDNLRLARDFGAAVAVLRDEKPDLVVMEVGANRWRADVLSAMIASGRDGGLGGGDPGAGVRPRWIVWLNDPQDRRVGAASLALGVLADRCYAQPRLEAVHEPGDDARELAPPPPAIDWEAIEQGLRAAIWRRQSERGGDVLLAAAVPIPGQPLWIVPGEDAADSTVAARLRIADREPEASDRAGAAPLVTRVGAGEGTAGLKWRLDPAALSGLGLVAGQARDLGQILAAERFTPRSTARRTVESGLPEARRRLAWLFEGVDAARERIDQALDEAERHRGQDASRRRQRAGGACLPMAEEAMQRVLEAERLTDRYPELLRAMPPGQTSVGMSEQRLSAAWVAAFQSRRQALTDLKNRASRLAAEAPR